MRIFPVGFTLTESSGAKVRKDYGIMGAAGIQSLGTDDVSLTIQTVLIPKDSPVPEGCDGFDHLPCLNTIWPLYTWELSGAQYSGPTIAPPATGMKKATIVDVAQTLDIELTGLGLSGLRWARRGINA